MPRLLELFSGTHSVGHVANTMGYEVISLDLKNADINCDILNWDYKIYPRGYFHVIHASPPCTEYSIAKTVGVRKIEEANKIVLKTLEIIEYFNPQFFILENPQTGLLKKQPFMYGMPYKDVDYCCYGMPYRKRTRIWNNITEWIPKPLCRHDCHCSDGRKHYLRAQRGQIRGVKSNSLVELYRIPQELIYEIFSSMS